MPRYKKRRRLRPDLVEAVGLIPFQDDPVNVLKTVLAAFRSFERSEPAAPVCVVLIWKLVIAGVGALGLGGDAPGPGKPLIAKRRHPASLDVHDVLSRFVRSMNGDDVPFDRGDIVKLKSLVAAGLEAVGFAQSAPPTEITRRSSLSIAERVRYLAAQVHDDVLSKRTTAVEVIAESARQSILRRKRSWLAKNALDQEVASIGPEDEFDLACERRTIERAFYRAKSMTTVEKNNRLAYLEVVNALQTSSLPVEGSAKKGLRSPPIG